MTHDGRNQRSRALRLGNRDARCAESLPPAIVHRVAPQARLLLDANAGLDAKRALQLIASLEAKGAEVSLFEQPLARDDWAGCEALLKAGVRLALDESVATAQDALEAVARLGNAAVFNIKRMKQGVLEAWDIAAIAKAAGVSLMIGGMVESSLAMTVSACFAAGLGGFTYADLDTHLFLKNSPFTGGLAMHGARLSLAGVVLGHGVSWRTESDRDV